MVHMLAQMSWPQWGLAALIIVVCLLLMIVILLQRGRGGGLSGAFGGGGGSAAFGAKTGDVFTWVTVGFTTFFVLLTVVANFAFDESARLVPTEEQVVEDVEGVAPADDATTDGGNDADVTIIDVGGEPITTGEGSKDLPIKITPVAPPADSAPKATGTPVAPTKEDNAGSDNEGADESESADDADNDGSGG